MGYPEFHYEWEWWLRSSPERLWPFVADTTRFNRDTGLPGVRRADDAIRENARQSLLFSKLGVRVEWEEEPFEWVRPYRFGVHRRYRAGPVASTRVLVELEPSPRGGTWLVYHSWIRPKNLLGVTTVPLLMGFFYRRAFDTAFRRYDELATSEDSVFEQSQVLTSPPEDTPGWMHFDEGSSSVRTSRSSSLGSSRRSKGGTALSWRGYGPTRSRMRGAYRAGRCSNSA
jgi:hypothetical protein